MRHGGGEFCDELLTCSLHCNGLLLSMCFTRQNYSSTLNHIKKFSSFCYDYFLIFKYDLSYLLKPVKICFI